MSQFKYKNNELYCEGVRVSSIAKKEGTPCYIYSYQALVDQFNELKDAFKSINPLICFALKANDNMAIIKTLISRGAGCDIVSGGELKKAMKVKADSKKIVFASVGKTEDEITAAIRAGILAFNVESVPELDEINRIAKRMRKTVQVFLRINPDVDAVTHKRITTGTLKNKFGIDLANAEKILLGADKYLNLKINGLHIHIGSQITTTTPFVTAIKKVASFIKKLQTEGVKLEYLDIGGGLGIVYKNEKVPTPKQFANALVPVLKKTGLKIVLEPGRFLAGNAGIFVTKVLYVKDNGVKKFCIVDGGMNDFARPSLYNAYHEIVPVAKPRAKKVKIDVVGPICESGDFFAKNRILPSMAQGDFIAIKSAGAYGSAMSSNYNVRARGAEILVKGKQKAVIKEHETFKDLIRGEKIPTFLK